MDLAWYGAEKDNLGLLQSRFQPSDYVEFQARKQQSSVMKLHLAPGEKVIALLKKSSLC